MPPKYKPSASEQKSRTPEHISGLDYFNQIDQMLVKQTVELLEAFIGFETLNKFEIYNTVGQQFLYAMEESDLIWRCFCPGCRKFDMHIVDNHGLEVLTLRRPFRCHVMNCLACCDGFQQEIEVWNKGKYLGRVKQQLSCIRVYFIVFNGTGEAVYDITGPFCVWDCCCQDKFDIRFHDQPSSEPIGGIGKKWSGLLKEMFTDADTFNVKFPEKLCAEDKSLLLAATFLIDFMFYEENK